MVGCNKKEDATQDCEQQQQNVEEEEEEINRIVRHSRPFTERFFFFLIFTTFTPVVRADDKDGREFKKKIKIITVRFFFQDQGRP